MRPVLAPIWILSMAASLCAGGCAAFVPKPTVVTSMGAPWAGFLAHGAPLKPRANTLVLARPTDPTHFGSTVLVHAIDRASLAVAAAFPGTPPLRVGDLSLPTGGAHPRHRSHRVGRDADILFYALSGDGTPVAGAGWMAFDRFGVAGARIPLTEGGTDGPAPAGEVPTATAPSEVAFFDVARNWALVRSFLTDPEAQVQWIFCSQGVKAKLLEYGARYEPDPEVLFRAIWVLHQPTNGRAHDDHFHVRVFCADDEVARGCEDGDPLWTWVPDTGKGPNLPTYGETDETLVTAIAEPLPE